MGSAFSLASEFTRHGGSSLGQVLPNRSQWQVFVRWFVPPAIVVALLVSRRLGFIIPVVPTVATAFGIVLYNIGFFAVQRLVHPTEERRFAFERRVALLQVLFDYVAMFVLIHYTGGGGSPLTFLVLLHIILSAILFPPRVAYLCAAGAVGGMSSLAGAEFLGWIEHVPILRTHVLAEGPGQVMPAVGFFVLTVLLTAVTSTLLMAQLRRRVLDLARSAEQAAILNQRLTGLYSMLEAFGAETSLQTVLQTVGQEIAKVLDVRVVTVRMRAEGSEATQIAATVGLTEHACPPSDDMRTALVDQVMRSGQALTVEIDEEAEGTIDPAIRALGVRSVAVVPMRHQGELMGTIEAYCVRGRHFDAALVEFMGRAADLVAAAIETVRRYEAIEKLSNERSSFMLKVAHNLRSPLNAAAGLLDAVLGGYVEPLGPEQRDYIQRARGRLTSSNDMVRDLLTLGESRAASAWAEQHVVDVGTLVEQMAIRAEADAQQHGVSFELSKGAGVPQVRAHRRQLEQVVDNLVSNAIKYSRPGGHVQLRVTPEGEDVVLSVSDDGIGIPRSDLEHISEEFFRATNVRQTQIPGTGLGLAFVRQAVSHWGGRFALESDEGKGTTATVRLPALAPDGARDEIGAPTKSWGTAS